ncbi:TrkA family potassium uptake protein [Aquiluna borgnonia]|uniref:TrkA family potassium uptake protein n=1 Tax=Aquiluna borgnonia TaxID=2499157 RepID=A0A7D4PXR9_9MICO|nr:TrkA family potassium uptake protein [Aquiluna borgnonia]QKJ25604.1 TrkA family potassium uptake protein [Aquiluna borgnonia]
MSSEKPKIKRRFHSANVAIIGLGRFGTALANELVASGHQVLGIDTDEKIVQNLAPVLTHVVTADTTDEETLRELGLTDMDSAVVAIGADLESSILTASLLLQLGVKQVWAKANSASHGRILTQIGVHHVIFPEYEMGRRVAHQVSGESLDYVHIDEDFVMVKTMVPEIFQGKPLSEAKIRATFGVTVVAVNHQEQGYKPAFPETVLYEGDTIVIAGPKGPLDDFCQLD